MAVKFKKKGKPDHYKEILGEENSLHEPIIQELHFPHPWCEPIFNAILDLTDQQKAEALYGMGMELPDESASRQFFRSVLKELAIRQGIPVQGSHLENAESLRDLIAYRFDPVPVRQFLEDPFYLGLKEEIYPVVMDNLVELNEGDYTEAVLTGGIGVAKTTMALWTCAYQLYLLSALRNPQQFYGLDRASEILFIMQSLNMKQAKDVSYGRFRKLIETSPYFRRNFPFDNELESELRFHGRIGVKPAVGTETGAIGENVIGGIIDEVNFMEVTHDSKKSVDGGTYDQASSTYQALSRRRESRFMKQGRMPGVLCLVSSKRYPGQFTDRKTQEAIEQKKRFGKTSIFVYDKRVWEVKPPGSFSAERFNLFVGDASRSARILDEGESVVDEDRPLVLAVPEEYRESFERDMIGSLRDIAGVSTLATHPFIELVEKITNAPTTKSIFLTDVADFVDKKLKIDTSRFVNPQEPRAVHFDLSRSNDATGMVIGHIPGFQQIIRGSEVETLPKFHIDGILQVTAPRGGPIQYYKLREVLYKLVELGMNIKWVTFDGYQSLDSITTLRTKGFVTGEVSTDLSTRPFDLVKDALYDDRLAMPKHELLQLELARLEYDTKKDKIDHPPDFSKDVADALAGVVYTLATRRELWAKFGVSTTPARMKAMIQKDKIEERDARAKKTMQH